MLLYEIFSLLIAENPGAWDKLPEQGRHLEWINQGFEGTNRGKAPLQRTRVRTELDRMVETGAQGGLGNPLGHL